MRATIRMFYHLELWRVCDKFRSLPSLEVLRLFGRVLLYTDILFVRLYFNNTILREKIKFERLYKKELSSCRKYERKRN